MARSFVIVGAGMVGVSVALHLRLRGHEVRLIDRGPPGHGTSFGNAGIIQREAVVPYGFPRSPAKLLSVLLRRGADIRYHASALPGLAPALARYWWHSAPTRHRRIAAAYATLIAHSLTEHGRLGDLAGAGQLLRKDGWYDLYRSDAGLAQGLARAEEARRDHGIPSTALDGDAVARLEPHLQGRMAGAIHWADTWTVLDPGALVAAHAQAFRAAGGEVIRGEATLRAGGVRGWQAALDGRALDASDLVLAAGPWATELSRELGYRIPMFVKRGYHMHYRMDPARPLGNWIADLETGYLLAPMRAGIRLTTGAELARPGTPPTPVQLDMDEAVARRMFPLGDRLDPQPWMGARPCMPDMLPVIGAAPRHPGLWFCFGHGHQGLTMGPASGRLLAELADGDAPLVDPAPFSPARFG
ncbi:NAD(P)/FAD-dependent oxidoreductase [Paracoccus yeei]|jgi:D-amino-acid dehydrogenase|uniref:NAD(P)/FAD-dependent oxidoreductase n=1 Tax=Paracoccus yeei TaxID=147645 RepID=UPI003BF8D126